jgi:hypothetical protein
VAAICVSHHNWNVDVSREQDGSTSSVVSSGIQRKIFGDVVVTILKFGHQPIIC